MESFFIVVILHGCKELYVIGNHAEHIVFLFSESLYFHVNFVYIQNTLHLLIVYLIIIWCDII